LKIEDILNITQGELINSPTIQAIQSATAFPSKVEMGDLFFATKPEDIELAIKNGAYGVIFEGEAPKEKDSEIAWIRVESIKDASFRLLRYVQLKKRAKFFLLKPHQLSFLKMILKYKSDIEILSGEWVRDFENILNGDGEIFVGSSEELIKAVEPNFKEIEKIKDGQIINDTLFKTTFKVDNFIYKERELSPIHFDYLLEAVALLEELEIEYRVDRVRYTKHFIPTFIDKNLNRLPNGKSERVVIFCDNLEDIVKAREYIKRENRWLKSIVLTPPKVKVENLKRAEWFESEDEAKEILKSRDFNYAFVYGLKREILEPKKREDFTLI
jgi:ferrochelatase